MDKHLHIVCFDVPYPPDYGGVTDIFYRLKWLHENGIKIHLHCFEYGRGRQPELNNYCTEVQYYKRDTGWSGFSFRLPYIVRSRANKDLLHNLLKDGHPVLLEGIHCTYFLFTGELRNKKVFVRIHNVEYEYYHQLAKSEKSFLKKLYFKHESRLLRNYEKDISNKAVLLAISKRDLETYQNLWSTADIRYMPAFLPYDPVNREVGKGNYCIYHGNLSVAENEKAALWLCKNVFNQLNFPLIIAGKNPSKQLIRVIGKNKNITLVTDPPEEKMNELIRHAQINVLPSFNATGIKIKLLNALLNGRHCIVNTATINGTEMGSLCHVANTAEAVINTVKLLFDQPFTTNDMEKREELLKEFDNKINAELLTQWIY